jgi:hypothetical protein
MIDRQIESPMPIPWGFVVKNGSKMRLRFSGDSDSSVFHCDQQITRFMYLRLYLQNPLTIHHGTHSVNGVHDQIHDYLAQLNRASRNLREFVE